MRENGTNRIRVGSIGVNPDRGWAAQAHIPALKSLPDDFEITALSTSRTHSALGHIPPLLYLLERREQRL
jgi:predicted dehydrogenase